MRHATQDRCTERIGLAIPSCYDQPQGLTIDFLAHLVVQLESGAYAADAVITQLEAVIVEGQTHPVGGCEKRFGRSIAAHDLGAQLDARRQGRGVAVLFSKEQGFLLHRQAGIDLAENRQVLAAVAEDAPLDGVLTVHHIILTVAEADLRFIRNVFVEVSGNQLHLTAMHTPLIDLTRIVVDEAHNIGSAHYRKNIPESIQFRLALSATIDRHNDAAGTDFLKNYFGKKCIVYSLEDAIQNGMLTPYRYYPVICTLDSEELADYLVLTSQIGKSIKKHDGKIHLTEFAKQLLIKRARIVAGARSKLSALENCISPYNKDNHILVYCGATSYKESDEMEDAVRQIDVVAEMLGNQLDMRVGRFTSMESAEERQQIRKIFAEGRQLQALVAIKCLDEGVNIPSIKTAFILASSTNPKEYIQRRGRVLRKFPGKEYAEIYDFITLPFTMESFLSQRSDVIVSTKGLIVRELRRMMDFASIADNPSETSEWIYKLKHAFNITEQDLQNMEVEEDAI